MDDEGWLSKSERGKEGNDCRYIVAKYSFGILRSLFSNCWMVHGG